MNSAMKGLALLFVVTAVMADSSGILSVEPSNYWSLGPITGPVASLTATFQNTAASSSNSYDVWLLNSADFTSFLNNQSYGVIERWTLSGNALSVGPITVGAGQTLYFIVGSTLANLGAQGTADQISYTINGISTNVNATSHPRSTSGGGGSGSTSGTFSINPNQYILFGPIPANTTNFGFNINVQNGSTVDVLLMDQNNYNAFSAGNPFNVIQSWVNNRNIAGGPWTVVGGPAYVVAGPSLILGSANSASSVITYSFTGPQQVNAAPQQRTFTPLGVYPNEAVSYKAAAWMLTFAGVLAAFF